MHCLLICCLAQACAVDTCPERLFQLPPARSLAFPAMAQHYVTYAVPMPLVKHGVKHDASVPGYLHICAAAGTDDFYYDVYSQLSLVCYPLRSARYHGHVGDLRIPLPYHPDGEYEVCHYHATSTGIVSCYVWRSQSPPTVWAHYEVVDISDPSDWWWGADYVFQDVVDRPPVSARVRSEGMGCFYRYLRSPCLSFR